jgi:purine catabolism regulator
MRGAAPMSITVAQALKIGGLRQGRLLAGEENLDNVIENVNVIEVLTESDWDSGWQVRNQLMLTTFHAAQDDVQKQIRIMELFVSDGCAALVFQQGILPCLSSDVVQRAEEMGLPLIEVPETATYPKIIGPVVGAILREKTFLLERSQEIHCRLTELILGGGGLDAIASAVRELIKRPVAIIDYWGNPLAVAGFERIPSLSDRISALTSEAPEEWRATLHWDDAQRNCLTPILAWPKEAVEGFILVSAPTGHLDRFDRNAVEQAATIAALDLAKQKAVLEAERRLKRDFIEDLLGGEYHSVEAIMARARSLGWELLYKRVVAVVDLYRFEQYYLTHMERGEEYFQQIKSRFLRAVNQAVLEHNPLSIVVERSDSIILMPHFGQEMPSSLARTQIQTLAETICHRAQEQLDELAISVAIGGFCDSVEGLGNSYLEAKTALSIGNKMARRRPIIWYGDVAHFDLLDCIADQPQCQRWLAKTLGPLLEYDGSNDTELVKTLETFFDCNQIAKQTAHHLSIHPKTLKYRLRRIEEILGTDPFSGDRQLAFYLATKLSRLL